MSQGIDKREIEIVRITQGLNSLVFLTCYFSKGLL